MRNELSASVHIIRGRLSAAVRGCLVLASNQTNDSPCEMRYVMGSNRQPIICIDSSLSRVFDSQLGIHHFCILVRIESLSIPGPELRRQNQGTN